MVLMLSKTLGRKRQVFPSNYGGEGTIVFDAIWRDLDFKSLQSGDSITFRYIRPLGARFNLDVYLPCICPSQVDHPRSIIPFATTYVLLYVDKIQSCQAPIALDRSCFSSGVVPTLLCYEC